MDLIPSNIIVYTHVYYLGKISSKSKIIYWLIIISIVISLGLLPFIYVDVSVLASGYFQSDIEKQIVTVPCKGKIVYSSLHNGANVTKGDTLLLIESESVKAQKISIKKRLAENDSFIVDLEILTRLDSTLRLHRGLNLLTSKYRTEYRNLIVQHSIQFQKYKRRKAEHERNTILYRQELIADAEFENSLFFLGNERENLRQIIISQMSVWQGEMSVLREATVRMHAELELCEEELSNRIILSPATGEILQIAGIQEGSIVSIGQEVAEITPEGDLVAICYLKPSDIGLIDTTKMVRIQVDAFNYHEWGMLSGKILNISDDLISIEGTSSYFRVRCKPDRYWLMLKTGKRVFVRKGMSFTARIVLVRRSLFNLLFDKADKWFNPYNKSVVEE